MAGTPLPGDTTGRLVRYAAIGGGMLFALIGIFGAWVATNEANRAAACLAEGTCLSPVPGSGAAYWQAQFDTYRGQTLVYEVVAVLGLICASVPGLEEVRRRARNRRPPGL